MVRTSRQPVVSPLRTTTARSDRQEVEHRIPLMSHVLYDATSELTPLDRLTIPRRGGRFGMPIAHQDPGSFPREASIMAKPLLSDELWAVIEPILPKWTPSPKGGQPRLDDRKALTGILFVLKTGIPWEDLPQEMGCGCGMTCWRRLRDWQADGNWD